MKGLKEKYLLFRAKSFNDTEAYGEIYDRYVTRIYRFVFFKVGNKLDAEDITSEAFLKAWRYIQEGQPIKNLNALLYSIARNLVIDHYRFQAKKRAFEEASFPEIEGGVSMSHRLDLKVDEKRILNALKALKDEYSEVIVLKFFDNLSTAETAQIIGKSQNNTRVLLHRALTALRKAIEAI